MLTTPCCGSGGTDVSGQVKPTREQLLARAESIRDLKVPAPDPQVKRLELMLESVIDIERSTR